MTVDSSDASVQESREVEPYAEGTPLPLIFGDTPKTKIIAALLSEASRDINISDIARLAGVSRSAVYEHLDDLIDLNIVEETREMGGSTLYQINTESALVEQIAELEASFLEEWQAGHVSVDDE